MAVCASNLAEAENRSVFWCYSDSRFENAITCAVLIRVGCKGRWDIGGDAINFEEPGLSIGFCGKYFRERVVKGIPRIPKILLCIIPLDKAPQCPHSGISDYEGTSQPLVQNRLGEFIAPEVLAPCNQASPHHENLTVVWSVLQNPLKPTNPPVKIFAPNCHIH